MKRSAVERWVARVVDRIDHGHGNEDDAVELKRQFKPTPLENARRIAGHANQARGDAILWIVGLDEDGTRHPVPSELADAADWWPAIAACFHEVVPAFAHVYLDGLLGIGFDTTRLPYVVQHPRELREVPWREATSVRSATRFDLLRLLVPQAQIPAYSVLDGHLTVSNSSPKPDAEPEYHWHLNARLYADVATPATLPDHRCFAAANFGPEPALELNLHASDSQEPFGRETGGGLQVVRMAQRGDDQLILHGSSPVTFWGFARTVVGHVPVTPGARGSLLVRVGHGATDRVATVIAVLQARNLERSEVARWEVVPISP